MTASILAVALGFASTSGAVRMLGEMIADPGLRKQPFPEFYPDSAMRTLEQYWGDAAYKGESVVWLGEPGTMFPADPAYMTHIEGNIFDGAKLRAVAEAVRDASPDRPIPFRPPIAQVTKIDTEDVKESILYKEMRQGRPLTTGDLEVDRYLAYPEDFDSDERDELQTELEEAVESQSGDLGEWEVQIRDGNHRAFGSVLGGEPVVWVRLMPNQLQDVRMAQEDPGMARPWGDALELSKLLH